MANNCFYNLKAVGKKESIKELIDMLNYQHKDGISFARIFSADVVDEWDLEDGRSAVWVYGDCAWSVYSCMMEGEHTYYSSSKAKCPTLTTITLASAKLDLDVEIYSTEPGIGFAEHYLIKKGEIVISDETDYLECYFDEGEEEFDEWKKEMGLPNEVTLDMFNDGGCYTTGGFNQIFEVDSLPRKTA